VSWYSSWARLAVPVALHPEHSSFSIHRSLISGNRRRGRWFQIRPLTNSN
jgi:hypothetical protein